MVSHSIKVGLEPFPDCCDIKQRLKKHNDEKINHKYDLKKLWKWTGGFPLGYVMDVNQETTFHM